MALAIPSGLGAAGGAVSSVFGRVGAVVAQAADYTLNQIGAATADYSINSHKLTNLLDPTANQDAATKHYVDSVTPGNAGGKGHLTTATAANTPADLAPGSDGQSLTADSTVAAGLSYKAGGRVLIFSSILGSAAATIDTGASAIPAGYTHLEIILRTASTSTAASPVATFMRFNNDSGANYTSSLNGANTAVLSNSGTSGMCGLIADAQTGADTAMFATSFVTIPLYSETASSAKRGWNGTSQSLWKLTVGNNFTAIVGGQWSSTAAINQITFIPNAGNFIAGSAVHIYGVA